MVLGLREKSRRGPSVQVDYIIDVHDIKPWPPTQSLKSVRSILIQWENGDRSSGSTHSVAPSIPDGKIEFNESFRLPVILSRDMSIKNGDMDVFHKNLLEFNLYEPRRDKTVKGQLLGTAIVDLADYGVINEVTNVTVPVNCTRSFRNTLQSVLYLQIKPYDKVRSNSSLKGKLGKESLLDKNVGDSISALISEKYADDAEVASLTDDDISSHSSALESNGASPSLNKEIGAETGKDPNVIETEIQDHKILDMRLESELKDNMKDFSSHVISTDGPVSPNNELVSLSHNSELETASNSETTFSYGQIHKEVGRVHSPSMPEEENDARPYFTEKNESSQIPRGKITSENVARNGIHDMEADHGDKFERSGDESSSRYSLDADKKQVLCGTESPLSWDRLKPVRSVRSSSDITKSNGSSGGVFRTAVKRSGSSYTKAQELEQRLKMLEGELTEAAGIEVALYSVVAEHGSSINKVHAPARRLSRLYFQAGEGNRRATTAQSAVSGLIVIAKACGNDVPRLTFWLSNCVMLRGIVNAAFGDEHFPVSDGPSPEQNGNKKGMDNKPLTLKWNISSSGNKRNTNSLSKSSEDWESPEFFLFALEKVEFWIFSRIVESVWWQTLTPHMQSPAASVIDKLLDCGGRRNYRRTSSSCDQEQANLSLELWKKAFEDTSERLCPLRGGGHECGCLPVLAKLIMEQCVSRLDVAMFNAILRESADDIPTDPVSDPISDPKVLPIPSGKSSFGAGAQLKSAIGNWSRWLSDIFGMDDDDEHKIDSDDDNLESHKYDSSFKSFYLLKSLSDLMMLPKDMLLSESIRKEVCPAFGAQLIKRVLENFVPDEFCSDPIPDALFEELDSEDVLAEEASITNFPCIAPTVVYSPPPASSLASLIGGSMGNGSQSYLRRSSSLLRKSNTSDDELDELDSPLSSILGDSLHGSPLEIRSNRQNHGEGVLRYQLLRRVWSNEVEL